MSIDAYSSVSLDDIESETPDFIWPKWVPRGFVTLLMGDNGTGKSYFRDDLIARITMGHSMPDGEENTAGSKGVILIAPEEDIPGIVKPRLEALGADMSYIRLLNMVQREGKYPDFLTESPFQIPDDIPQLEQEILKFKASLVVIDPIKSVYNGSETVKQIYDIVMKVQAMAMRRGIGVLIVCHTTKSKSPDWRMRLGGSKGWSNVSRSVISLELDSKNPELRILNCVKHSNYPLPISQLVYKREKDGRLNFLNGLTTQQAEVQKATRISQTRQDIKTLLESDHLRVFTPLEISQETAIDHTNCKQTLRRMADEGIIEQVSYGKYKALRPVVLP